MRTFNFILKDGTKLKLTFTAQSIFKIEEYFDCPLVFIASKADSYFRIKSVIETLYLLQSNTDYSREEILGLFPLDNLPEFYYGFFTTLGGIYDEKKFPDAMKGK